MAEDVKNRFFEPRVDKIRLSQRGGVVRTLPAALGLDSLLSTLPRYRTLVIITIQRGYKVLRDCVEVPQFLTVLEVRWAIRSRDLSHFFFFFCFRIKGRSIDSDTDTQARGKREETERR